MLDTAAGGYGRSESAAPVPGDGRGVESEVVDLVPPPADAPGGVAVAVLILKTCD